MNYHLKLHEQYGPLVRIGPKHVSFSDSSLIPQVYGITSKFWKSDFYKMFDIKAPGGQVPTVFSVRDENRHKGIKRPIAGAYSMNIDFGKWVHWYAFDVITSITFSNRMGFMEQERDVQNIIAAIEGRLVYNSIVGQAPYLHKYLFGNAFTTWLVSFIPAVAILNSSRYIVAFAARNLQRYQNKEFNTVHLQDMLDRFKRFREGEQVMNDDELLSNAASNIFAGSDTTAASLRAIFYYLCRNPEAHKKLLAEIDAADRKGELSDPVTFAEAQNLRYFQAVIKEALRMHPAVGLLLERVVPAGGAEVSGLHLPEGTIVGMNPWVAARDKVVYSPDPYAFRPERWLEADEQRLKVMERNFLAFGSGTRTCLGKNISQLEMAKVVPQVLRRFDFELVEPGREWEFV
ncbi:hypothetical protein B0A55_04445 [Friedmanniomyces simplex]|uniref:Pisatin demethylase n=1 Tax=Friedmanniomyces simplex TaxID=329884 RepID=A0A4V5NIQ4_9PEZI|nr:hypothetical protein B0A55_04445 [Friedmanniomyces simplex]